MSTKTFSLCSLLLLITALLVFGMSIRGEPVVVKTNLEKLPLSMLGLLGTEDSFPDSIVKELKADKMVYRHYRSKDGRQVDLYIGYYGTAKGGRSRHVPDACLPGAGWGIIDTHKVKISSPSYPDGAEVTYILARKGDLFEVVLHWYQSAGQKVLSSGIEQNINRFFGRILYNRDDGAFIRVSSICHEDTLDLSTHETMSFAAQLLEIIPRYWPVEE